MPGLQSQKEAGRRALVQLVKDCLAQVNGLTVGVGDIRTANNKLAEQTGLDVKRLDVRADALNAWCKKLESAHSMETRRLTLTRVQQGYVELKGDNFALMTFRQRFTWLLTGKWPCPSQDYSATPEPTTCLPGAGVTSLIGQGGAAPIGQGYIPHTSLGPRVLP